VASEAGSTLFRRSAIGRFVDYLYSGSRKHKPQPGSLPSLSGLSAADVDALAAAAAAGGCRMVSEDTDSRSEAALAVAAGGGAAE